MNARRLLLVSLMVLAALGAGAVVAWRINERGRTYYTDADRIRTPASDAPIRRILWQPAEPVPTAAGTGADEYEPRVSADGATLVFVRGRAGANADLYTRERTAAGWGEARPIASVNTEHDELGPELSPDGKSLYFYSDRPGGLGGYDLWVSHRIADDWGEPVNLGPAVNTSANEYGPALTPDGKHLYFSSNRPRPGEAAPQRDAWPATIREQRARHDYDLYRSDLGTSDLTPAVAVTELNTTADEGAPAISPAGDFLYFASDRAGGLGGFDIYRARLLRGQILAPEALGPAVNSEANDLDPALSMDGFRLYFSTDRPMPQAHAGAAPQASGSDKPARYSLWVSGSREVFTEVAPAQTADLLSQLWLAAWPWLLLLLLVAVLAAMLYLILRDATMRRRLGQLSLMAKCLLVSLLIHAMILSLLAAWRVGNAIGDAIHSSGGSRVSLGSVGSGGIASQVRAAVTSVAIQSPTVSGSRPAVAPSEILTPNLALAAAPAPRSCPPRPRPLRRAKHNQRRRRRR